MVMSRTRWALMTVIFVAAMGVSTILAQVQSTVPTETQRRECERNGGYWATAAGMCRIGA
jgi:hypothetical protein